MEKFDPNKLAIISNVNNNDNNNMRLNVTTLDLFFFLKKNICFADYTTQKLQRQYQFMYRFLFFKIKEKTLKALEKFLTLLVIDFLEKIYTNSFSKKLEQSIGLICYKKFESVWKMTYIWLLFVFLDFSGCRFLWISKYKNKKRKNRVLFLKEIKIKDSTDDSLFFAKWLCCDESRCAYRNIQ
ncbi:hypothetical protein RFI_05054 [Reticulomyxa filosa]|uniref:Uncharacterized protein n=1 Tax=Reticulomyxa filosa TaxID=46433 RepID=X6P3C1_RETFI|nr:hypothetical protein RFI_05054 [Reticulomyxa filosa]|eukprot:ETO32062.1 hypothetical protein RFI_05054 [Reticulomyxa filosa]